MGQNSISHQTLFPKGISIEYGLGKYSVRDEYISKEKYSGTFPNFKANWSRFHNQYGYNVGFEYRSSSKIKNYNISADIKQFSLHQEYLYPLSPRSLFSRNYYAFLGPSTGIFFFYNRQKIAVGGFDYSFSYVALFSLGVSSEVIFPIGHRIQAEGSLRSSILSLGLRMVDMEEEEESPAKPLTVLSGTNASIRLGLRYYLWSDFSMKFAYRLQVLRISSWDPLLSASDDLLVTLTYKF